MNQIHQILIKEPKNITQSAYLWNMIASTTTALSSVVVLALFSRFLPIADTGSYSFAVALSNIAYIIATFNILNYQVTDTNFLFSFTDYFSTRIFTNIVMLIALLIYLGVGNHSPRKLLIVLLYCCYRSVDSFCEVFQGDYQRNGRLDVGCKLAFFRQIIPDFFLIIIALFLKNLWPAVLVASVVKIIVLILMMHGSDYMIGLQKNIQVIFQLLRTCFPLFISAFLMTYIQSAPKLIIDQQLGDQSQLEFNVIFLPAMIIHLFAGMIYRPLLTTLSYGWNNRQTSKIFKSLLMVTTLTISFTIVCILVGAFVGIPILSALFHQNITIYRTEFLLILLSGGFNALSTFYSYIVTIARKQTLLSAIYGITAIFIAIFPFQHIFSPSLASITVWYTIAIFIQSTLMFLVVWLLFRQLKKR